VQDVSPYDCVVTSHMCISRIARYYLAHPCCRTEWLSSLNTLSGSQGVAQLPWHTWRKMGTSELSLAFDSSLNGGNFLVYSSVTRILRSMTEYNVSLPPSLSQDLWRIMLVLKDVKDTLRCVIPVVCVTNGREENVVEQHN